MRTYNYFSVLSRACGAHFRLSSNGQVAAAGRAESFFSHPKPLRRLFRCPHSRRSTQIITAPPSEPRTRCRTASNPAGWDEHHPWAPLPRRLSTPPVGRGASPGGRRIPRDLSRQPLLERLRRLLPSRVDHDIVRERLDDNCSRSVRRCRLPKPLLHSSERRKWQGNTIRTRLK